MSGPCYHCGDIKRLTMRLDRDGHPEYLCAACHRELADVPEPPVDRPCVICGEPRPAPPEPHICVENFVRAEAARRQTT